MSCPWCTWVRKALILTPDTKCCMIQFANKESLCLSFFPVWPKDMMGALSTPTCLPPPPPPPPNLPIVFHDLLYIDQPVGFVQVMENMESSCVLLSLFSSKLWMFHRLLATPLSWLLLAYDGVHLSLSLSLSISLSLWCPSSCKPVFILVFGTLAKSSIYNEASKGAFLPSFPPVAKRFCVHC